MKSNLFLLIIVHFVTKMSLCCMLTTSDWDNPAAKSRTKDKYIFWLGYGSGSERPLFSQSKQPVPRVPTTRHFTSARIKLLTVGGLCFVSVFLILSSFYLYLIYQVLLFLFWTMIKEIENENGRYILRSWLWRPGVREEKTFVIVTFNYCHRRVSPIHPG